MSMNAQGRPSAPQVTKQNNIGVATFTGNRGLQLEEPLIFEQGTPGRIGVDLPKVPEHTSRLGNLTVRKTIGLPDLSEPQVVRHYTRLSQKNCAIDSNLYPLGSCTMKHNPRLNEKMARLPGFADVHPLQPEATVQGALAVLAELGHWLMTLTGMPAVTLSPGAGAHGEYCGMLAIKAAHAAKGSDIDSGRDIVLVPESAHGTNPATAAMLGYKIVEIPADARGRVDVAAFKEKLSPQVAAIMLTNPNTCGLFENDIVEIAADVHSVGAYFYCDGANFNAIAGRVKPGDLGIDAMHINLHKTFSTPHGGGGPGAGPVVFSDALAPYAPVPYVVQEKNTFRVVEHMTEAATHPGRLKAFHGQMGMFVRALAYMLSHGADGIWQASTDAVLNANYIRAKLQDIMSLPFAGLCMHEVLFDETFLNGTGVTTLDFAKAMLDEGYHPMTMYFPLVVKGAMLIEPTESESKQSLDQFIGMLRSLVERAKAGDADNFKAAPQLTPRRRLDETRAARQPVLRWTDKAKI